MSSRRPTSATTAPPRIEELTLEQHLSRIEVSLDVLRADVTWLVAHGDGVDPVQRLIKVRKLINARLAEKTAGGTGASPAPPPLVSLHCRLRRIELVLESAQADLGQLLAGRDNKSPLWCLARISTFVERWITGEGLCAGSEVRP